ncbi:enoyl-CoA hydratase-related protein [Dactylosporangium sp. NBC_01737]|uniref:enoyl-CoA hydratase/isomerase family protein n=1 Tax=Dactylosporangium sp. NBC_01737 TaxID=2975959 RepID=UPI002E0EBC98|nr:enoyl-CoA hydratase-related protein [Dactylosporangium sp. NBC_01737]
MRYEEHTFAWADTSCAGPPGGLTRIRFDVDDGIATVTLDRPDRLNAIDRTMLDELSTVLRWCDADDDVGAVVLTGAGRAFCAGSEMTEDGFGGAEPEGPRAEWIAPYQVRKPVLAAVQGAAVGAGLTLAMQCDVRFVADDAVLALPFVRLGVTAEWMGHWNLVRHVGLGRAHELLLTGRRFTGAEAAGWGLAAAALPSDQVLPRAHALARDIVEHAAPVAVAATKRLLWEAVDADPFEHGRTERQVMEALLDRPDAREGIEAFLRRRRPAWSGRASTDLPPWPSAHGPGVRRTQAVQYPVTQQEERA